jgi:4-carboxymuconolactone decarboxylase
LLKRHIERGLNLGLTPEEVVEVFIQLTFYVGVPAVETAMRIAKEIFEEQSIQFSPNQVYDTNQTVESLYELGLSTHREHMGDNFEYQNNDPDSEESQLERLITEYHWGAIYNRPILSAKDRAMCALSAMTVMGRYDRQIRNHIVGALRVGMTPAEIMEVFIQMTLYGGYLTTRTAMRIARSVFTEQGISS